MASHKLIIPPFIRHPFANAEKTEIFV